jgi:hypothetical protein
MPPIPPTRRLVMAGAISVAALLTAGCGDNEAAQAETFQKFLQTRILDRQRTGVPRMTDEERKSFGRFAADYDVIQKFNGTMNDSVGGKIGDVVRRGAFSRAQEFIDRREDLVTARDAMKNMGATLDGAIAEAERARAGMKQPEQLKAVYDQAFGRIVTEPAKIMREVLPTIDAVFAQGLEFSDFLTLNKADLKFNGILVETSKPALQTEFNRRAQELNRTGQSLLEAQRKLQAMVRGGS